MGFSLNISITAKGLDKAHSGSVFTLFSNHRKCLEPRKRSRPKLSKKSKLEMEQKEYFQLPRLLIEKVLSSKGTTPHLDLMLKTLAVCFPSHSIFHGPVSKHLCSAMLPHRRQNSFPGLCWDKSFRILPDSQTQSEEANGVKQIHHFGPEGRKMRWFMQLCSPVYSVPYNSRIWQVLEYNK